MSHSATPGAVLDTRQIRQLFDHIFRLNLERESRTGERPTPICLWGAHGLGKTELVRAFARQRGWAFASCAPAQFEEMGDFHGLPVRAPGSEVTTYLPPAWVPRNEGPGILLLDDVNRADDRILRGLMQLLQDFSMNSWQLPPRWQIVCTANPEDGDYSVTPMDDALRTRMLHLTLRFDAQAWAAWALESGVDPRGVDFVLTYPESVTGRRTTPRSLCQFFAQLRGIPDLRHDAELVRILAQATLDEETAIAFAAYVQDDLAGLLSPTDILEAGDLDVLRERIRRLVEADDGALRLDRLSTVCTRLRLHLASQGFEPLSIHRDNLVAFLLHPSLPKDLRFALHGDLMQLGDKVRPLLRDPRLAAAILLDQRASINTERAS